VNLVAFVHMYPPMHNAGAEHMMHAILSECVRHGHPCTAVVSGSYHQPFADYDLDRVRVTADTSAIKSADWILTHLDRTAEACSFGKPVAHIVHNNSSLKHYHPSRVDLVVYNTQHLADAIRYKAPSIVVHPPIWPDRYSVKPPKTGCVTLINLSEAKGGALFFALARAMPDVRFLGVRGAYGRQLPTPDIPNLEVMDTQTDVRKVYRKTRVLLMPSSYESYGRCAMEAAVSGIPCIANPTPGLVEALGEAGTFPAKMSVELWERAIRGVLVDWDAASSKASARAAALDPSYDVARLIGALESQHVADPQGAPRGLSYPIRIAVECKLGDVVYPAGSRIDRATALALKEAGQLTDHRIQ
jgi:hypothetical protein